MTTAVRCNASFRRFVALSDEDAPQLLQRMSGRELPVDGQRYGVITRLIAKRGVHVVDLAEAVLQKLLRQRGMLPRDVGGLVLSSRIVDVQDVAENVGKRLQMKCPVQGIERACSGFPAATDLAMQLCHRGASPVVLVAAEIISTNVNWEPSDGGMVDGRRARGQAAKLFGDAAAAVLVVSGKAEDGLEIFDAWASEVEDEKQLIQKTDVDEAMDPWGERIPGTTTCMSMPGRRGVLLLKRAPGLMADAIGNSLQRAQRNGLVNEEPVAHVIPHQANGLIVSALDKELSSRWSEAPRVWNCMAHHGNTVSASIPVAMATVQDHLPANTLIAMPSVGAGGPGYRPDVLSVGCVLCRTGATMNAVHATT
jgi:3-oxoacyl-[acyl-carrier-protein] synthase III